MTLTDREKALVEAVYGFMAMRNEETELALNKALRAYDHPKPKEYTMPSWEEFSNRQTKFDVGEWKVVGSKWVDDRCMSVVAVRGAEKTAGEMNISRLMYDFFRELTAKDSA